MVAVMTLAHLDAVDVENVAAGDQSSFSLRPVVGFFLWEVLSHLQ